jgi:hypothetical protein
MIKLILEITQNNIDSPQKPLGISCQSVLIPHKISVSFYAKNTWSLKKTTKNVKGK